MEDDLSGNSLTSFEIRGLFKRFNHFIEFEGNNDLTIITAPNGYGKTAVLRAIDAFFNRKFSFFGKPILTKLFSHFQMEKELIFLKSTAHYSQKTKLKQIQFM